MTAPQYDGYIPEAPAENVPRGTVFALAVVPLGIVAFVVLWNFNWLASIVGFGVAAGAVYFYRLGSGGRISRAGATRIAVITIATMLLAFVAAVVFDVLIAFTGETDSTWIAALTSPEFWAFNSYVLAQPGVLSSYLPSFLIGLGLSALGCFSVLRGAFQSSKVEPAAAFEYPITPTPGSYTAPDAPGSYTAPQAPGTYTAPPVADSTPPTYGERVEPTDPNAPKA